MLWKLNRRWNMYFWNSLPYEENEQHTSVEILIPFGTCAHTQHKKSCEVLGVLIDASLLQGTSTCCQVVPKKLYMKRKNPSLYHTTRLLIGYLTSVLIYLLDLITEGNCMTCSRLPLVQLHFNQAKFTYLLYHYVCSNRSNS